MTSQLNVDTIADKAGSGPVGLTKQNAAKAFTFLTGASFTASSNSLNISSVTDNGTGRPEPSFSNAFSSDDIAGNANTYARVIGDRNTDGGITTTSYAWYILNLAGSDSDIDSTSEGMSAVFHGDLA
tara:strand:- start:30 stop:410 length:381 start_codon:yes stop_codon:yes gene_type:complete